MGENDAIAIAIVKKVVPNVVPIAIVNVTEQRTMPRAQLFFIPVLVVIDDAETEPPPADFDFETDGESVTEARAILAGPGIRKAARIITERRAS